MSDSPADFGIRIAIDGRVANIAIHGEVDLLNAGQVLYVLKLACEDQDHVVVDLSEVTFIDSSGLKVLARARDDCGENLHIGAASSQVMRALTLMQLDFLCIDPRDTL